MNASAYVKHTVTLTAIIGFSLAQGSTLPRADYNAEKVRIGNEYKAADTRCGVLAGHARDECVQEAKFSEKVALADLEYRFTGAMSDERKYETVKAEADYAVAMEKCGVQTGKDKDVCIQEAKSTRTKSLPYVKMSGDAGKSGMERAKATQSRDYEVAMKRCDIFQGETKSGCIISVKAKFGKS